MLTKLADDYWYCSVVPYSIDHRSKRGLLLGLAVAGLAVGLFAELLL